MLATAELPPLPPQTTQIPIAELECEAFDAIERIVASPEFLKSIEAGNKEAASTSSSTAAGGTAKKQGAIKRTFLRWGTGKEVELQHKPLLKPIPSEPEPKTQEEELSAAEAEASTAPFLVVDSTGIPSVPSEDEDFIVVERHDAIEAMAYYIAICVMDMPEAQAMTPAALQQALSQTLRGLRKSKFKQVCNWGRQIYRWGTLSYSALQMYQNPWLVQAVLTAIWYAGRTSLRIML